MGAACPVTAAEACKDLLHPAGTLQGWLLGDHQTASLAGDGLFVGADVALAEEGQFWDGHSLMRSASEIPWLFCLPPGKQ